MVESLSDQNIKGCPEYDPQVTEVALNLSVNPHKNILAVANKLLEYGVRTLSLSCQGNMLGKQEHISKH